MTVQDRPTTDQDRSDSVQDRSEFVPVAEAARRLGISAATVKRRIAAGTLEAEQLTRPQGIEYRVRLPRDVPSPLCDVPPPLTERSPSEEAPSTGTAQDQSAAIAAAVAPLVERLVVQDATIAEQARMITHQAGEIADLREQRGRHVAELERATSAVVTLGDELQASERSRQRDARRMARVLAVVATLALAAVAASAWVR